MRSYPCRIHFVLAMGIVLIPLTYVSSYAQIQIGVYAGSITTQLEGDNHYKAIGAWFEPQTSFNIGMSVDFPIKEDVLISFQPGYKWSGGDMTIENDLSDPSNIDEEWIDYGSLSTQYVSLPLFLKLISDNKKWQFIAGFETTLLAKGEIYVIKTDLTSDASDGLNKTNYSVAVGFGYRFKLLKNQFSVDLRYSQGLNNASTKKGIDPNFNTRLKLVTAETRLAWYLPFGRPEKNDAL